MRDVLRTVSGTATSSARAFQSAVMRDVLRTAGEASEKEVVDVSIRCHAGRAPDLKKEVAGKPGVFGFNPLSCGTCSGPGWKGNEGFALGKFQSAVMRDVLRTNPLR